MLTNEFFLHLHLIADYASLVNHKFEKRWENYM